MFLLHDMLFYILTPWLVTWYISPLSLTSCMSITCYCFISDFIIGLLSITCQFFRLVSFRFPFNTCISPDYYYLLPWLNWIIITIWHVWLIAIYLHLVMLSFHTQHDIIDLVIIMLRESYLIIIYGTKCHIVQWWGPPLEPIPSEQSATSSNGGGHLLSL